MKKSIITIFTAFCISLISFSAKGGNPLDALGGIVSSLTSTSNFEIADIVGTWEYQSPAISFKSDAALSKIGGVAASAALEDKLVSYYNAAGLNTLVITINSDDTFTMKVRSVSLNGTIAKDGENGALSFQFSAFGKINIGAVSAYAEKSALNTLTLTFDVSKIISIIEKISEIVKIQSIQTLTSLLGNYDGLYAGARLKKTGSSSFSNNVSNPNQGTTDEGNASVSGALDALKGLFGK